MTATVDRLQTALADRYEIKRELGHGGMATVYLARDLKHDREVALKVLKPNLTSELGAERFTQEIKLAARLSHPHILPLYDSGEVGGLLYYVMPAMEGQSVRDRLTAEKQLPVEEACRIAREVADALDYAHQHDVVHRDIKPENILLHGGHALVADFGIGKALSAMGSTNITQTGVTIGTPTYMSPEQAVAEKEIDGRSDLYSLGCVLYEMLAGEPPFTGATARAVITKRFVEDPTEVTTLRDSVPANVSIATHRLLAKSPVDRFPTGRAFAEALESSSGPVTVASTAVKQAAEKSVAVLPFNNMSSDPENEFFSDGISEEIINALVQIPDLHVAARTSAFSFKGKHEDLRVVGEKLNVRTVLEGSVRKAGKRLRITAQLINVDDGYHLWSDRYDRQLEDVFQIQDEIARTIAGRLKVALAGKGTEPLVKKATENIEAYQLYMKGRALLYQRGPSIPKGLECFKQAVALDPDYALAWAGLADAHNTLGYSGFAPPEETMPKAKDAALRAVELDPNLAEARNALACVTLLYDRDQETAEREFLTALELNPKYIQARCWYGLFYLQLTVGRHEDALAETRRAAQDDPLSSYTKTVAALTLSNAGHTAEAVEEAREAVEHDPDSFVARWILQVALHQNGQFTESAATAEQVLGMSGRHPWPLSTLAVLYADWGKTSEAQAAHDELMARAAGGYVPPSSLAVSAAAAGKMDDAIAFARQACDRRDAAFSFMARYWMPYQRLRADERFGEILKDL